MTPSDKKGKRAAAKQPKERTSKLRSLILTPNCDVQELNSLLTQKDLDGYSEQDKAQSTGTNIITLINPNYQKQQGTISTLNSILLPASSTHYSSKGLPQIPLPPSMIQLQSQQIQQQQQPQAIQGEYKVIPPLQSLRIVPTQQYEIKSTSPSQIRIFSHQGLGQLKENPSPLLQVAQSQSNGSSSLPLKSNSLQNNQQSQFKENTKSEQSLLLNNSNHLELNKQVSSSKKATLLQQKVSPQKQPPPQAPQYALGISFEGEKQKKKYKHLVDSDSEDEILSISIKKKKIHIEEKPQEVLEAKQDNSQQHTIVIQVPPLNINKSFQEVLQQTSKDINALTMVRNILSAGSKKLAEKQIIFKKKWYQLRTANIGQRCEYLKWEEQLKNSESYEIKDIKETIIQRLVSNKIRGFVSQEQLAERGKQEYLKQNGLCNDINSNLKEFIVEQKQYEEFRNDQFKLLEKLMKENNLVATDNMKQNNNFSLFEDNNNQNNDYQLGDGTNNAGHSNKTDADKQLEFLDEEENQIQKINLCKYFGEKNTDFAADGIFNSYTYAASANNGFLQSQSFDNNIKVDPEVEGNIEKYAFQRIFNSYDETLHLKQKDICKIPKRVRSLLLDIKSDELFTDAKFQKEQFEKYSKILKSINDNSQFSLQSQDDTTISGLVEITAYIMNNVHYFQKFNLKCDLLHPLDLLNVDEKFLRSEKPSVKKNI